MSVRKRRFIIHDGMIGVITRSGGWAQLFLKNIQAFEKGEQDTGGRRIDVRDLDLENASHIVFYDDELDAIRAFRLTEIPLDTRGPLRRFI